MRQKICWKRHVKRHKFFIICLFFWVFCAFWGSFFYTQKICCHFWYPTSVCGQNPNFWCILEWIFLLSKFFCNFGYFVINFGCFLVIFYCQIFFEILVFFDQFLLVFGRFFVKAPSQQSKFHNKRHLKWQSAIMSAISTVKAPFGAQRHSEIFERHFNFESATLASSIYYWIYRLYWILGRLSKIFVSWFNNLLSYECI